MLDKLVKNKKEEKLETRTPNVNIYEQEKHIVLELEMPGVDKNSLDVNLDRNTLTIKGNRKKDDIPKEYTLVYHERPIVEYQRVFELNTDVDRENLSAQFMNGILKISLAKSEKALPKKIEIQT